MNLSRTSKIFVVAVILEFIIALPGLSSGFGEIWLVGTLIPTVIAWRAVALANRRSTKQITGSSSVVDQKDSNWRRIVIIIIILAVVSIILPLIISKL